MTLLQAVILGIIEGLTEFLPISSTGHLYLSRHLMGIEDNDFTKAFDIIIQVGAMLAVVWYCRSDFLEMGRGFLKGHREERIRVINLFTAFFPAAAIGFVAGSAIKRYLFAPLPIVAALVLGGLALWWVEARHSPQAPLHPKDERHLSTADCFRIGLFQCLALWPGTSRAMSTILGGRFLGLSPQAAARFSFLLAVPTLVAASGYDALKNRQLLFTHSENLLPLIVGILVSFVVALAVIKAFMAYLAKRDLKPFAYYRIVVGLLFYYFLART